MCLFNVDDIMRYCRELDELATSIYAITGYELEDLLGLFEQGYTLKAPDSNSSLSELSELFK